MQSSGVCLAQSRRPSVGPSPNGSPITSGAGHGESPLAPYRLKTFIVEDSKLIRDNLIAALEELAPVDVVGTAEEEFDAVRWLGISGIGLDLVIIDIFLKRGSGLGVLRAAQSMPDLACKRVVLSNYATLDIRQKCLDLGADRVFDKSHDIDELIRYCSRLAGGEASDSGFSALR
jgi:DNA-binding NarL/FixJ family response regulator